MRRPGTPLIVVGLLLSLVPATFAPVGAWGRELSGFPLIGTELLWWVLVAATLLYVAFVERRPFSSIGFRRPRILDIVVAVITGVLMVVGIVLIYFHLFPALGLHMNDGEMGKLMNTPYWYRVLLVTRAAVAEETLFRGYPLERLQEWTGSRWLAAIVTWAAFTYAHLSGWGAAQLIVAGFGGVLLTALYVWRRNLWANMLAHWIADGAGFLLPH
ncbi:MAG TPA: type II CAAX endopeptidase family protein [Rhizomicrobium sp.]